MPSSHLNLFGASKWNHQAIFLKCDYPYSRQPLEGSLGMSWTLHFLVSTLQIVGIMGLWHHTQLPKQLMQTTSFYVIFIVILICVWVYIHVHVCFCVWVWGMVCLCHGSHVKVWEQLQGVNSHLKMISGVALRSPGFCRKHCYQQNHVTIPMWLSKSIYYL